MWEKGSSMAAAVAAGSPDQGLKHDLKIQTWRRMCKLMLLTWRGERAAPCKNAERGRALAPSIISRYGSAHQPCPLDLIAPPPVVPFVQLRTEMLARWRWGSVFYLRYLPEQLPLRVEDPGSLDPPERHTTAWIGQHNSRRASPFQLQSQIVQLPNGWRRERGWQTATLLHGDIQLHLICPTEECSGNKNVNS